MAVGDVQRLLKAGFGVRGSIRSTLRQSYLTLQAVEFSFAPTLIRIERQGLENHTERRIALPRCRQSIGQSPDVVRNDESTPFGTVST